MPFLFLLISIMSLGPVQASDASQATFVGCLSRLPEGTLQLGVPSSGEVYSIEGNTQLLIAHVNQLVRVSGRAEAGDGASKLVVSSVQVVGDTCTAGLPGAKTQTVVGKVGADQVAIPVTTTASSDETTPGFQTEAGMAELSRHEGPYSAQAEHPAPRPYAPLEAEQIAQSESAANVNAEAALRAEILPGNTLGVSGVGNAPASSNGATSNNTSSTKVIVVNITGNGIARLSPQRVNIRAGETIQWKNSSGSIHEIVANPAKARANSVPSLPAGAGPFDSGFLRPNRSFSYRFTVPGVYRYVCDLDGAQPVMGEIVVAQ